MAFSRMIWKTIPPTPSIGSWDFWVSAITTGYGFMQYAGTQYYCNKVNNKIAFYASIKLKHENARTYYTPLLVSPDADAVTFTMRSSSGSSTYTSIGSFEDDNGITWYYSTLNIGNGLDRANASPSGCQMYDIEYAYDATGRLQAAKDLVDKIYAVSFRNNYVVYGHYEFTSADFADSEKTFRKVMGAYLFLNIAQYNINAYYRGMSDNADQIIQNCLPTLLNDPIFTVSIYNDRIYVMGGGTVSTVSGQIDSGAKDHNYQSYRMLYDQLLQGNQVYVAISSAGVPSYSYGTTGNWYVDQIGVYAYIDAAPRYTNFRLSNVGIDL